MEPVCWPNTRVPSGLCPKARWEDGNEPQGRASEHATSIEVVDAFRVDDEHSCLNVLILIVLSMKMSLFVHSHAARSNSPCRNALRRKHPLVLQRERHADHASRVTSPLSVRFVVVYACPGRSCVSLCSSTRSLHSVCARCSLRSHGMPPPKPGAQYAYKPLPNQTMSPSKTRTSRMRCHWAQSGSGSRCVRLMAALTGFGSGVAMSRGCERAHPLG